MISGSCKCICTAVRPICHMYYSALEPDINSCLCCFLLVQIKLAIDVYTSVLESPSKLLCDLIRGKPESSLGRVGQLFDCWNNWSNSYWALPNAQPPYHGLHLEEENGFSNLSTHTMISWYLVFLSANPNQYSDNAAKNYCWSSFCGFCQQWFSWASSCLLRLIVWPLPNLWLFRWMGGWMPNRQTDRL